MRTLIEYYIWCFDRYLVVEVNAAENTRARQLMDTAYDEWHALESDDCCEEYICNRLHEQGINLVWKY